AVRGLPPFPTRRSSDLAPHIEGADALGAIHLVGAEGHQIHRQGGEIDGYLAGALGGIHMERHPAGPAQLADGGDVIDHPDLVVEDRKSTRLNSSHVKSS